MYSREAAVRYADQWWNGRNPAYPSFDVDCTNYISQCLRAGGAPMYGYPNRGKGWWLQGGTWSFSWSVSHSLHWYVAGSKKGLTAKKVSSPYELDLGDLIFYDFQGDGRYDHSTIVTAKDINGAPLVNAHTYDAYHRTWDYKDSYAWRESAQYAFFKINDNFS
ncbi:amidase domain-containing protein [Sporosarcina highlanderae]|uniref:Amidase domain-containing protein n=1 Tax=Sporosarcina highlanderae TaxID=3035916 RepID=A0ABT8JLS1_9BACL|nr:amidase domain-containing protein [Sporosarcina highlanderae]MDN4606085.1 amidase domain-containing protein [Sporosarcina highlanderae]